MASHNYSTHSVFVVRGILLVLGVSAALTWFIMLVLHSQELPAIIERPYVGNGEYGGISKNYNSALRLSGKGDRSGSSVFNGDSPGIIVDAPRTVVEDKSPSHVISARLHPIPNQVMLDEVPVGKQTRALNCEFQTASDLAWYYGFPYNWDDLFKIVGHDQNGNPHVGFVGRSFDDAPGQLYPNGYGVYAEPIANALAQIGLSPQVHYQETSDWLKYQLSQGRPVMIWATANMSIQPVETWHTKDGKLVKGVRFEHTYLVVGYDEAGVWLADPWDAQKHYFGWNTFLASWNLFDRMSIIVTDNRLAASYH